MNKPYRESFFAPTTRYQEMLLFSQDAFEDALDDELEAKLTVDLDELRNTGMTWDDLYSVVVDGERRITWMQQNVFVHGIDSDIFGEWVYPLVLIILSRDLAPTLCVYAPSPERAVATCDFLVNLMKRSEGDSVILWGGDDIPLLPVSDSALLNFMESCNNETRSVHVVACTLDASHFRALENLASPDLKIVLQGCALRVADADAGAAFWDCLQRNRGPTELHQFFIDTEYLAAALHGNKLLEKLSIMPHRGMDDASVLAISEILEKNSQSLEYLSFHSLLIGDDSWSALCHSLRAHSTLTILRLTNTGEKGPFYDMPEVKKANRMRAIRSTLQSNTRIHTIQLTPEEAEEHILEESILPRLEMNRTEFESQRQAIARAPATMRAKLLGPALYLAQYNSNLAYKFLSDNAEVLTTLESATL
jgi:hypothetical protein